MWLSACTNSALLVSYVAMGDWVAGLVSVGSPTVFSVAVGGWAVGAVNVGCPTAINVAVGGWAVDSMPHSMLHSRGMAGSSQCGMHAI